MPDLPHTSVVVQILTCPKTQMDKTVSELMTVLNFLDCESRFAIACAADRKAQATFLSVSSTAVRQARQEETSMRMRRNCSSASMEAVEVANRLVAQSRTIPLTDAAPSGLAEGQGLGGQPVGNDAQETAAFGAEVPSKVHHVGNGKETLDASRVTFCPGGHSDACRWGSTGFGRKRTV